MSRSELIINVRRARIPRSVLSADDARARGAINAIVLLGVMLCLGCGPRPVSPPQAPLASPTGTTLAHSDPSDVLCSAPATLGEGELGLAAARQYYASGLRCFKAERYSVAASWFRLANHAHPHPNVIYMIAVSLDHDGDHRTAFQYYNKYLLFGSVDAAVQTRIDQLERHLRLFCPTKHKVSKSCLPPPLD